MKYMRNLAGIDSRVYSVSPQSGKASRPHIGIIVMCNMRKYCIPLTTPKAKHYQMADRIDFTKMVYEGEFIGAINFSRMIPVEISELRKVDIKIRKHDNNEVIRRKQRLLKTLAWCTLHEKDIINKANVLYNKYLSREFFKRREDCLDFPALERGCDKYHL